MKTSLYPIRYTPILSNEIVHDNNFILEKHTTAHLYEDDLIWNEHNGMFSMRV